MNVDLDLDHEAYCFQSIKHYLVTRAIQYITLSHKDVSGRGAQQQCDPFTCKH